MFNIRQETPADQPEIDRLMALGFASSHSSRNIWQLRHGQKVADLCLVAEDEGKAGHLLGSIRYWPITINAMPSLLLGPLAVDPELRGQGIGRQLVRDSLALARSGPWAFCFVSGERDYYPKLGFSKLTAHQVDLPAPIEEERLHIISVSATNLEDLPEARWVIRSS
jgi:predicted N-acetyltransferase YhbS